MLTITITAYNGQPMANPVAANFDAQGGSVGRSPENVLVLLDQERKISRVHATITCRDGDYVLRNQGSVVPTILNGQPIGSGCEAPLRNGDEIRIGTYVLRVTAAGDAVATPPVAAGAVAGAAASPASIAEPVLSWATVTPAAPGEGITTVYMAAAAGAPAPATRPVPAHDPAEAPAAATPAATAPASGAATDELLRALLAGAGVKDVNVPGGLTPELMETLGRLLRVATSGLLDLLAARASAKRQVRADMTVISTSDNNPLKFSPNLDAALTHLLVPRGRGFMAPLRAVGDAYDDLKNHQQGFMAGMHSALAVVLARFDPEALERRLAEDSMIDSFLPTNRKAKLWDQFGNLYAEIASEAENDFHTLFGQEFLKSYREHTRKDPGAARSGR